MEKFDRREPDHLKGRKFTDDDDHLSDGEMLLWACVIGAVMFIIFRVV